MIGFEKHKILSHDMVIFLLVALTIFVTDVMLNLLYIVQTGKIHATSSKVDP